MDCQFVFLLNFIYQSINGMCWIDKSISSSLTFTYIPFTKTPKKMLAEVGGGTGIHLCLFLNTFIHSSIFSHALICHLSPLISRTLYRHYRNTAAEGRWEG